MYTEADTEGLLLFMDLVFATDFHFTNCGAYLHTTIESSDSFYWCER